MSMPNPLFDSSNWHVSSVSYYPQINAGTASSLLDEALSEPGANGAAIYGINFDTNYGTVITYSYSGWTQSTIENAIQTVLTAQIQFQITTTGSGNISTIQNNSSVVRVWQFEFNNIPADGTGFATLPNASFMPQSVGSYLYADFMPLTW